MVSSRNPSRLAASRVDLLGISPELLPVVGHPVVGANVLGRTDTPYRL